MEAGLLEGPSMGLNSLTARRVEEHFWVHRQTFRAPAEACAQRAWLVFERLEPDALALLNGEAKGEAALAENCFDLLPGVLYTIAWTADLGEPRVVRIGSRDAVEPRTAGQGRYGPAPTEAPG